MGGGYDVFCGLPVYLELVRRGKKVHLASFSFSDIARFAGGKRLTDTLVGVLGSVVQREMQRRGYHLVFSQNRGATFAGELPCAGRLP
jgi:hypothetical protein